MILSSFSFKGCLYFHREHTRSGTPTDDIVPAQPALGKWTGKHHYKNKNMSIIVVCVDPVRKYTKHLQGVCPKLFMLNGMTAISQIKQLPGNYKIKKERKKKKKRSSDGPRSTKSAGFSASSRAPPPKNLHQCLSLCDIQRVPGVVCNLVVCLGR